MPKANLPHPGPLDFEPAVEDGYSVAYGIQGHQAELLRDVIHQAMAIQDQPCFHVASNQFLYYDVDLAREIAADPFDIRPGQFRGPDLYFMRDVEPGRRDYWLVWEEDRFPDLIVEFTSEETLALDHGAKKMLYQNTFRTPEYMIQGPERDVFVFFRLEEGVYQAVAPDERGWVWSEELACWIGPWRGPYPDAEDEAWIRLYDAEGRLVPTEVEAYRRQSEAYKRCTKAYRRSADAEAERAKAYEEEAEAKRRLAEVLSLEAARIRGRTHYRERARIRKQAVGYGPPARTIEVEEQRAEDV